MRLRRAVLAASRRDGSRRPADRRPSWRCSSGSSTLTFRPDSICCRCRSISAGANAGCRAMSDSICRPVSKLSFITTMLTNVRSVPGAGAHRAADEVDRVVHLLGRHRRRALIEQRRGEVREPELLARIERGAGAHQHPHADRRLLVVQDRDDLQTVGQRPDFVGRKLDVARRQRPRRPLGRPVRGLRRRDASRAHSARTRQASAARVNVRITAPAFPDGINVSTSRFSGREVGPRDALHVGGGDVLEDVELAVGGLDVVVDHDRVRRAAAPSAGPIRGPRM